MIKPVNNVSIKSMSDVEIERIWMNKRYMKKKAALQRFQRSLFYTNVSTMTTASCNSNNLSHLYY
jgi:hypothetical protein